jgi:hypothetical protein
MKVILKLLPMLMGFLFFFLTDLGLSYTLLGDIFIT